MTTCVALWAICDRGYVAFGLLSLPLAAGLLWRLRIDAAAGAMLNWRSGVWTLEQFGVRRGISPRARCAVTPWAICLVYADLTAGYTGHLWIYIDSAPPTQLRQLRVRLTLMR